MGSRIVQSSEIVTLIGAGPVADDVLHESLTIAPKVIAADGGAKTAMSRGRVPEAVIGDFDSLDSRLRAAIPPDRLHHIADQNTTDFEKALSAIAAPLILAVGFTGQRLDHELAVYNALVRGLGPPVIVLGEEDLCFALTGEVTLALEVGTRISLFPMAEVRCANTGLRWPTDHLTFRPWGRVGTSNEAALPEVTLRPSGTGMLVIMPRDTLTQVIAALVDG
ncbi:MAG: thiamine diphosphokinase [Pseudomonadota bacterium]